MRLSRKQFNEIGPWHFNDLPFDSHDQDFMLRVFNILPSHIQADAISWGCSDSVFRDNAFEFLVKTQFGVSVDEFYAKGMWGDRERKFDFSKYNNKD